MPIARAIPPPESTSTSPQPNPNVGNAASAPCDSPTTASLTQIRSSTSTSPTARNMAMHDRDEYIGTSRTAAMPVSMTPSSPATLTPVTARSISSGEPQGSTTPTPTQATFSPTSSASASLNPATKLPSTHSNTVKGIGTETSASTYSTSGSSAKTSEFGLISLGSTPLPAVPTIPTQYQREFGYRGNGTGGVSLGLPPGAAPSVPPGSSSRVYEKLSVVKSNVYLQGSVAHFTTSLASGMSTVSASMYPQVSAPSEMDYPEPAGSMCSGGMVVDAGGPPVALALVEGNGGLGLGMEGESLSGLSMSLTVATTSRSPGLKVLACEPKRSSLLARALSSDAKIFLRE